MICNVTKILFLSILVSILCSQVSKSQGVAKDTTISSKIIPKFLQDIKEARDLADSLRVINLELSDKIESQHGSAHKTESSEQARLRQDIALEMISVAKWLLAFTFLLIISILIFLYFSKRGFGSFAFQIVGLIVVVNASLFMILTGYDKDQITPIVGLLGTIVGFIFGSNLSSKHGERETSNGDIHK